MDAVVLKLEVIQGSPCNLLATDSLLLKVGSGECFNAEANAGGDQTICEGFAFIPEDASVNFAEDFIWSTSGDGTFDDPTKIHPIYTPGDFDVEG